VTRNRGRLQFGLRKMLLWTLVIALYLAVVRWERWDLALFAVVTSWLIVVAIVRAAFGPTVAAALSALAGAIPGGWLGYVAATAVRPSRPGVVLFGGVLFCIIGCILFAVVEIAIRAVNWVDGLFASRPPEDSGAVSPGLAPTVSRPEDTQ
jgi:hypothetical protein